ncbi:MAG: hypothetical protein HQ551_08995 [Desulfobacteraceae bacterium]|nr:hypothetical protein [Desulfobacteraceae bacterium]
MGISFKKFVPLIAGWSGGLAVNSFIGQPQKVFFATKMAFPACYVLMVNIPGAFHQHVRILVADFLKEIPMTLFHLLNMA